jgi:hypothetical protein
LTDIFTEVEEDLRRERAKRLWDRYGWIATAALLLVVLGTAGWQGWKWYQAREAAAAATRYLAAMQAAEANRTAEAAGDFATLLRDAPSGYRLLARFQEAAARARAGERDIALAMWDQLAADGATPQPYRDLAALMSVLHQADTGDPAALSARLAGLDRPDGAFRFSARELQAVLAERQGQRERAVSILRSLAEAPDAPMAMRSRAAETLGALTGATPAGS